MLVGIWAAAEWAIQSSKRHRFERVAPERKTPSAHDVLDRPGSADRDRGRSGPPAARLTSARRRAGRRSSFSVRRGRSPQYHPDRYSSDPVRDSGTADLAKAKALVKAPDGIVGPHAEAQAKPAASSLAAQPAHT